MVQLSVNDFASGEFAISQNQNNIIADFDFDKAVEKWIVKGLGVYFLNDYKANPNKYNDIIDAFYFKEGFTSFYCKGLKYALKSLVKSELLNLQRLGLSDYGATVPQIEAAFISEKEPQKMYNRGVTEMCYLTFYINKTFDVTAVCSINYDATI